MIRKVWVGLEVEWPEIKDAHITLAFIPELPEHMEEDLIRITGHGLAKALDYWFPVSTVNLAKFQGTRGRDAHVAMVRLPDIPGRLVDYYRRCLMERGVPVNTEFEFKPHVTMGHTEPGETFDVRALPPYLKVKSVFIDWSPTDQLRPDRSRWHLKDAR